MTRKVKETLKLVAESSHYINGFNVTASPFMCYALAYAALAGLISKEEEESASRAIEKYIDKLSKDSRSLPTALEDNNLPSSFVDQKAIYLDWKNRPKPWKRNENCSDC